MATYQEALKFVQDEIRSYELAPAINLCEMTEEWKKNLDIFRTIERFLKVIVDEN